MYGFFTIYFELYICTRYFFFALNEGEDKQERYHLIQPLQQQLFLRIETK